MLKAKLVVVGGDAKRREVNLKSLPCVIGRGKEATLTLPHPLVSRRHTELFEQDGQLWVRDLGSLNGTFLNNERLEKEQPLAPNQLLTLGNVTFRAVYEVEDSQTTDAIPTETLREDQQGEDQQGEDQQDKSDAPVEETPDFSEQPQAGLSGLSEIDATGLSSLDMLTTQPLSPSSPRRTERAPEPVFDAVQTINVDSVAQRSAAEPEIPVVEEAVQVEPVKAVAENAVAKIRGGEDTGNEDAGNEDIANDDAVNIVSADNSEVSPAQLDAASQEESREQLNGATGSGVVDLDSNHDEASEAADTDMSLLEDDGESRISLELDEQPAAAKSISLSSLEGLGALEDVASPAAASFTGFQIVDEESEATPESVIDAVQLDLGEDDKVRGSAEDDDKGLDSFIRNLPR